MKRTIVLLALVLAGCGVAKDLRPEKGASLPPKPYGASVQPNAATLLKPSTQARPLRTDDVLTQSQDRPSNSFDLPPP